MSHQYPGEPGRPATPGQPATPGAGGQRPYGQQAPHGDAAQHRQPTTPPYADSPPYAEPHPHTAGPAPTAQRFASPTPSSVTPRRPRRGPFGWIVDQRGLTFVGAVIVSAFIGVVGGVISSQSRSWIGLFFIACFTAGCVLAAALAHREDLIAVLFMPPIVYTMVTVAVGVAQAVTKNTAVRDKVEFQLVYALGFEAKAMWLATGATLITVLIRLAFGVRGVRSAGR